MNVAAERSAPAPNGVGGRGAGLAALYATPNVAGSSGPDAADEGRGRPVRTGEPRDLVARYAARTAGHRNDLRGAILDRRAGTVLSPGAPGVGREAGLALVGEPVAFGRGTAAHREVIWRDRIARREARRRRPASAPRSAGAPVSGGVTAGHRRSPGGAAFAGRRRAAVAVIGALTLLVGAVSGGMAQARYRVQEGDTLASVAATFGVDPAAIATASYIQSYPDLTPGEVIVIPDPGQTPQEAAAEAAAREGTSPWVVGAHVVQPGETLGDVGHAWGLDAETLAAFNEIDDPENLRVGTRLLIPPSRDGAPTGPETAAADVVLDPELDQAASEPDEAVASVLAEPEPEPASAPAGSFVPGVGTYVQSRNLSCEYAASYIATSAFGAGVPEWVFIEQVPQALNPHFGYRGNIDGWWGNTDDYGVYPEALAPVLNANGFAAHVFYGGTADLTWYIDQGMPVLVWLGLWGDTAVTLYDEGTYAVAAGMHVVVAYGYDANGVYISDPANGSYKFYGWSDFEAMWSVLAGMALAVAPY